MPFGRSDGRSLRRNSSLAGAPRREQGGQIKRPDLTISVEICRVAFVWPPRGEQLGQVERSDLAIAVQIRRAVVFAFVGNAVAIVVLAGALFNIAAITQTGVVAIGPLGFEHEGQPRTRCAVAVADHRNPAAEGDGVAVLARNIRIDAVQRSLLLPTVIAKREQVSKPF